MILQEIIWPIYEVCSEQEMYVRINDKAYMNEQEGIHFYDEGKADFDTYFNGCSIAKWRKYTKVENVRLRLELQGDFCITLYQKEKVGERLVQKTPVVKNVSFAQRTSIELSFPDAERGMLCFGLEAHSDDAVFYGGAYETDIEDCEVQEVKIGIVICTFKREVFVERNLKLLEKHIMNNPSSPLKDHLEVFVSDNGKTLDIEQLQSDKIHIVKNKNAGGAGGFTRGLIEILEANQRECGVTHALLMDDDIVIDIESIRRTYRILRLLKEEYKDAFIGGAMLRLDQQNIQVEAGASWNAGHLIALKCGLDLNLVEDCVYNEFEEYTEYNAWWYCCFPMSVVSEENLPLPVFIRGDDLEYGLRNMKTLILMNGICVWHEPFENKYSSFLEYYIIRNQLIDNSIHFPDYGVRQAKRDVCRRIIKETGLYRYKNVDLIIRAVEDFLKGPKFLEKTDPEVLHREIMAMGYKAVPAEECSIPFHYPEYEATLHGGDMNLGRIYRGLSLNGNLIPDRYVKGTAVASMSKARMYTVYKKRRVMYYDESAHKGFEVERSRKQAGECMKKMYALMKKMDMYYERSQKSYQKNIEKLQNMKFWKKYLSE